MDATCGATVGSAGAQPAPAPAPARPSTCPPAWSGVRCGDRRRVHYPFNCIGAACVERGGASGCTRHDVGTLAQPYVDAQCGTPRQQWQHMCVACDDEPINAWRQQAEAERAAEAAARSAALGAAAAAPTGTSDDLDALDDDMMDRALQAAEAAKAGGAPPVSFISHERERKELGKPCWSHIASEIPRVQHDGSLAMPGTGRRDDVDLSTLRRRFPSLPFVKFEGAARATVLYEEAPEVTEGVMAQVRACFAAEAAGLTIALCMPELWARKELMQEERYCVKVGGKPVGCKLPCPGCGCNTFVLMGGVSADDAKNIRFAYGNGKAIMPVSRQYSCFGPDCPLVRAKKGRTQEQLDELRALVDEGVTGANAAEKKQVTKLKKLGISFFGHDMRVIDALPRQVSRERTLKSRRTRAVILPAFGRCARGTAVSCSGGSRVAATTSSRAGSCSRR